MLTSARIAAVVVAYVAVVSQPAAADPKPPPVVVVGDNNSGVVSTTVTAPGTPGSGPGNATGSASAGGGVTCAWEQLDGTSLGLGFSGGAWYDVTCSDGSVFRRIFVPTASPVLPVDVARAEGLAQQARNRLALPAPAIRHNPAGRALVGLPTWWWVDPAQWRQLRQRTQAGPVWAEVTATPVRSTWDPGDGSTPVTCDGPGTAYDTGRPEAEQSTDCATTYRRSSADQPQRGPDPNDRFFTVTVTTTWRVTWLGSGGSGGTLQTLTTTNQFPLAVAQRQTVVTGGSG